VSDAAHARRPAPGEGRLTVDDVVRYVRHPWALEVSARTAERAGFPPGTTFHPTFLYESVACALLGAVLLWWDRARPMRAGRLFAVYVMGYTSFRFFIEGLRIDEAKEAGGLRLNQWTSLVVFATTACVLCWSALRRPAEPPPTDDR